jgi:hypothetical protein
MITVLILGVIAIIVDFSAPGLDSRLDLILSADYYSQEESNDYLDEDFEEETELLGDTISRTPDVADPKYVESVLRRMTDE